MSSLSVAWVWEYVPRKWAFRWASCPNDWLLSVPAWLDESVREALDAPRRIALQDAVVEAKDGQPEESAGQQAAREASQARRRSVAEPIYALADRALLAASAAAAAGGGGGGGGDGGAGWHDLLCG